MLKVVFAFRITCSSCFQEFDLDVPWCCQDFVTLQSTVGTLRLSVSQRKEMGMTVLVGIVATDQRSEHLGYCWCCFLNNWHATSCNHLFWNCLRGPFGPCKLLVSMPVSVPRSWLDSLDGIPCNTPKFCCQECVFLPKKPDYCSYLHGLPTLVCPIYGDSTSKCIHWGPNLI